MLGHRHPTQHSPERNARRLVVALVAVVAGLALSLATFTTASATTFTVTTTADADPVPPAGSLREAILLANSTPGADIIEFAIPTLNTLQTIQPVSALPDITEQVLINGTTQVTGPYLGVPLIEI